MSSTDEGFELILPEEYQPNNGLGDINRRLKNQLNNEMLDKYLKYSPANPSPLRKSLEIESDDMEYDAESSGFYVTEDDLDYPSDLYPHVLPERRRIKIKKYKFGSDEERLKLLNGSKDIGEYRRRDRSFLSIFIKRSRKNLIRLEKFIKKIDIIAVLEITNVVLSPSRLGILISSILYNIKLLPRGQESKYDKYYKMNNTLRNKEPASSVDIDDNINSTNNDFYDEIDDLSFKDPSSFQLYKEYGLRSRLVKPPILSNNGTLGTNTDDNEFSQQEHIISAMRNSQIEFENEDNNTENQDIKNRSLKSNHITKGRRKRYDLDQDIYELPSPFFEHEICHPKYHLIYNFTCFSQLFINGIIITLLIMIFFTCLKLIIKNEILDKLNKTRKLLEIDTIECQKNYDQNNCGSGKIKAIMIKDHCIKWKSCINKNKDIFYIWQKSNINIHILVINGIKKIFMDFNENKINFELILIFILFLIWFTSLNFLLGFFKTISYYGT